MAVRHLDDESAQVAALWADVLARGLCTAVEYHAQLRQDHQQQQQHRGRRSDAEEAGTAAGADGAPRDGPGPGSSGAAERSLPTSRFGVGRKLSLTEACGTLPQAIAYLVDHFAKAGGELNAQRLGGAFSVGGRAVRVGWSLALTRLLELQSVLGNIGDDHAVSIQKCVELVLKMLGGDMEKELNAPLADEATTSTSQIFGGSKGRSKRDACLVRIAVNRILRQGLSEVASEPVQLSILHALVSMVEQKSSLNANQIQILLVEISHLISALGEATSSSFNEIVACLTTCLSYNEHGVRHEAAIACAAVAAAFPTRGRQILHTSLEDIRTHLATLVEQLASTKAEGRGPAQHAGLFRRTPKASEESSQSDLTLPQQCAIHGKSLLASLLIRDLPRLPGGLLSDLADCSIQVASTLIGLQFDDMVSKPNPAAMCMCVISGFTIISGLLATGPSFTAKHTPFIIKAWQRVCESAIAGANLQPWHDLFCVDAALSSVVTFLKFCSELLLTIPEALSNIGVLLENIMQLLSPSGRLGGMPMNPSIAGRYERALASLLEAFAWLPSGSFPMAADDVFNLAARQIKMSIELDIPCSVFDSVVNNEDSLLDLKTPCRARTVGQVCGARGLEETIATLTSETAGHGEREAVIHLVPPFENDVIPDAESKSAKSNSVILDALVYDSSTMKPPTPLHDIGSWRCPLDPSISSKVRLVDAAIQAFAATFGLKSDQEQQEAIDMLESLVPASLTQQAQSIGIGTVLPIQERTPRMKEDDLAVSIIVAVLLTCLRAIPLQDSTKNTPVGLGSQWMNKTKMLLLSMLPSTCTNIRRCAAESLALLATVGVTEDAHFLQSALLHSVDELMQGHKPDGKTKTISQEHISAARSGSLLTLCCIQRTQHDVTKRRQTRVRDRTGSTDTAESLAQEGNLPLLQMMARILPSATYYGLFRDFFIVKAHALHAYAVFLAYSGATDESALDEIDLHLIRKGVELVEGNFTATWTMVSGDIDRGQESEKLAAEAAFLAALLRLMTLLTPHLHHFKHDIHDALERFSVMASLILEAMPSHPGVTLEAMAFFEVLSVHSDLLPCITANVEYTDHLLLSAIPFIIEPQLRPAILAESERYVSNLSVQASVHVVKRFGLSKISVSQVTNMKSSGAMMALLEVTCSKRYFTGYRMFRSLAAPSRFEKCLSGCVNIEKELIDAFYTMVLSDSQCKVDQDILLRWILFSRSIITGMTPTAADDVGAGVAYSRSVVMEAANRQGRKDALRFFTFCSSSRWQTKTLATQLINIALESLYFHRHNASSNISQDPTFNLALADQELKKLKRNENEAPPIPRLVFHLEDLISLACSTAVAAVDHSELRALQSSAVLIIAKLVEYFGPIRDPERSDDSILDQFSTQILASVRNATGAAGDMDSKDTGFLFIAGCMVLESIIKTKLVTDSSVLSRLIRAVVPKESTTVSSLNQSQASSSRQDVGNLGCDRSSKILVDYGKIVCVARIMSISDPPTRSGLKSILLDLVSEPVNFAVQSATICIEGARVLLSLGFSLAGKVLTDNDVRRDWILTTASSINDLNVMVPPLKRLLAASWASCGCYALRPLLSASIDKDPQGASMHMVETVVGLLVAAIYDVCSAIEQGSESDVEGNPGFDFVKFDYVLIGQDCLRGLGTLVESCPQDIFIKSWRGDIEAMFEHMWSVVVLPVISKGGSKIEADTSKLVPSVLEFFMRTITSNSGIVRQDSSFLVSMLKPLDMLQQGKIHFAAVHSEMVVSSCFEASSILIQQKKTEDLIVRALLSLLLDTVFGSSGSSLPQKVLSSASLLLRSCFEHDAISLNEKSRLALDLAQKRDKEGWIVILSVGDGCYASDTFEIITKELLDSHDVATQLSVLSKLRKIIQKTGAPNPLTDRLLRHLGAAVVGILVQYGTAAIPLAALAHRQAACADAMKILLVGYQQISSLGSDHDMAAYLLVTFECFLSVMRFNGLPHHPSPSSESDPALGRMCAQAITNIARISPVPFKMTIASLSDTERQLLELSVRAEMSGYAGNGQAPVKKSLNIKSFAH